MHLIHIYSIGFKLGLVDRIRGTYLDYHKSTITWNHDNREKVGGSSVATVKVTVTIGLVTVVLSYSFCLAN